jgi:hypothetical protein
MFEAPRWYPPPVSIKDRSSSPDEQVWLCTDLDHLSYSDVYQDRVRATYRWSSVWYRVEDMH